MTEEEKTRKAIEAVNAMTPEEVCAFVNAVIKKENAKKARREAREAQKRLDDIRRQK